MSNPYPLKELNYALDDIANSNAANPRTSLLESSRELAAPNLNIKVSDFTVGAVANLVSDKNSVAYNQNVTFQVVFAGEQSRFNFIKLKPSNYDYSINSTYLQPVDISPPFFTFKNVFKIKYLEFLKKFKILF
jgi:hypothetical protein